MKRIVSVFLVLVLLVSIVPFSTIAAEIADAEQFEQNGNVSHLEEVLSSYENIADGFNHTNYLARYYTSDRVKSVIEYRINDNTNCYRLVEYLDNNMLFQEMYKEWAVISLITDPVDTLNKHIHKETYYETVIFNIINAGITSDNAIDWLNQGAITNSVKILNSMTKYAETDYYAYLSNKNILISELTDEEYDKMMKFTTNYVNSQNYKIIGSDLSFLSDVLSAAKDIEEYSERLASYCQLFALGDQIADFLEIVNSNTDDKYLRKAIDNIMPIIRDSYNSMLITAAKDGIECIGKIALENLVGELWEKALIKLLDGGVLYDGTAIVNAALLALSVGKTISNIGFSVDQKMDQYELMRALCSFETAMEKSIYDILNNYQNTEEYSNLVLAGVSIVYQTYITDADIYSEMVMICQKDWGSVLVEDELNRVLEISNNNKQIYQTEYDSLKPISGFCGDFLGWVITSNSELIIYGVGAMYDYEGTTSPWYSYRNSIITAYLSSYISTVGSCAFKDCSRISEPIVIPNNVVVNSNAFKGTTIPLIGKGDLTLSGDHTVNDELFVLGNLYGSLYGSSSIRVDKGVFRVNGNLTLNAENPGYNNVAHSGFIIGPGATLIVGNDFSIKGYTGFAEGTGYIDSNLYGDVHIGGDFNIDDVTNTYFRGNLSVNGDLNQTSRSYLLTSSICKTLVCSNANCIVNGDFTIKGACYSNVDVNWAVFEVEGGYFEVKGNLKATDRFAALRQTGSDSKWIIRGNVNVDILNLDYIPGFNVGLPAHPCTFSAGTLVLCGNYTKSGGETITPTGSHTICLSGENAQTIAGLNTKNLTITNTSAQGVCFSDALYVTGNLNTNYSKIVNGKNIHISGGKLIANIIDGDISVQGDFSFTNDITIRGTLYAVESVTTQISVPKGVSVTIEGNASFKTQNANTVVRVKSGAKLIVLGNLILKGNDNNPSFHYADIYIDGDLLVGGDLSCTSCYHFNQTGKNSYTVVNGNLSFEENRWFYSYKDISAGTVAVKGKVHNYEATGENILLLNGTSSQKVNAENIYSHKLGTVAAIIEIENTCGVDFTSDVSVSTLFNHKGNSFTLYNNGTGSVFADFDFDGLKDNVDPQPTVGFPVTIYIKSNNTEQGTVSTDKIETYSGSEMTITATPSSKYEFSGWANSSGSIVSYSKKYTFIAKKDGEIFTALFHKRLQPIFSHNEGGILITDYEAEIESLVTVEIFENDGYIYKEGSLKYNDIEIENNSFIMPDEPVYLTAEFIRNEHYFALRDMLSVAKSYTYESYTEESFKVLVNTIANAEQALVNNISEEDSLNNIQSLQSAIDALEVKEIPEFITVYFENSKFWGDINYYAWGGAEDMEWPGAPCTHVYGDVWSATVPGDSKYIIFNDGIHQTADMAIVGDNKIAHFDGSFGTNDYGDSWPSATWKDFYARGDATLDGSITILDATEIQQSLVELIMISEAAMFIADVNDDGIISIMDATLIQMYIAQIVPSL